MLQRLTQLLGAAALLTGVVLSLGWSYAYEWFRLWQMPLAALSIGADGLLQYGRLTVIASLWFFAALFILAGLVLLLVTWQRGLEDASKWAPALTVAPVGLIWLLAQSLGERAANDDFDRLVAGQFQALPLVELVIESQAMMPTDFVNDISGGGNSSGAPCYRLVYTAPDAVWIARTRNNSRNPVVAMVPRAKIVLLRLYPPLGNCMLGV